MTALITQREDDFVAQSSVFIDEALRQYHFDGLGSIPPFNRQAVRVAEPLLIEDYRSISTEQKRSIREAYESALGVAHFLILNPDQPSTAAHPLLDIAEQLSDTIPLRHPLSHPLENHPEVLRDFGRHDGTVKVRDVPKTLESGYREQGETAAAFDIHHDGLGTGGTVEAAFLYCDSRPLWGGFTYFQNIITLSLELARLDIEAFKLLFLPNAISILRPRGKGALKVVSPVLYINEAGRPQSNYRKASGEYVVEWRTDLPALRRARDFLEEHTQPFASGGSFTNFTAEGQCCIIRNEDIAHGRTSFINSADGAQKRCLSRKWFMRKAEDAIYKHVPGISILERYAKLFPDQFGPEVLVGEWLFDSRVGCNVAK